jgi:hypothetical protein
MSQHATISIVVVRVDCQRADPCIKDQGCAFGNRFKRLFVVFVLIGVLHRREYPDWRKAADQLKRVVA